MRFVTATTADIPALSRLWKQAFGDTDAEITRFFQDAFPHALGFAAKDGDSLAAMCFALPQQLAWRDTVYPAAYLYAVATDLSYRKQGICKELLAFAEQTLQAQGYACVLLVPADENLAHMYEKFGYHGEFSCSAHAASLPPAAHSAQSIDTAAYAGLRETLLWDIPHVRYAKHWLDYEAHDARFYALSCGSASGCAAVRHLQDGSVQIDEYLPDTRFLPALANVLGTASCVLPQKSVAMFRWLCASHPSWSRIYLAFDFG